MIDLNSFSKRVAQMPSWPGPKDAIKLAQAGVRERPPFGLGLDFPDGTAMLLDYQLTREADVEDGVYEHVGEPPLLCVTVFHRGVGVKMINGMATRVREHDAEKALRELQWHIGTDTPLAVISKGLGKNRTTGSQRYFWRIS